MANGKLHDSSDVGQNVFKSDETERNALKRGDPKTGNGGMTERRKITPNPKTRNGGKTPIILNAERRKIIHNPKTRKTKIAGTDFIVTKNSHAKPNGVNTRLSRSVIKITPVMQATSQSFGSK